MKLVSRTRAVCVACLACALLLAGCTAADNSNANTTVTTSVTPPTATPEAQNLTVVERPQKIKEQMAQRGQQEEAAPTLRFLSPTEGATVNGATVNVKLALTGDLKGYKPMKDPQTQMGNHIHIILDNQPYEAYYNLDEPFELRNVTAGKHTLRVFASRPWHESYKNNGSFQMVTFTVRGGGDASKPTTTATGQTMADNKNATSNTNATNSNNANHNANTNAANTNNTNASAAPREGKDVAASEAGAVEAKKPLLTYSRPKGEYKGADAGSAPKFIDKWEPIWLAGWTNGSHKVKLELVDKDGNTVENGGYNSTTREITVVK
jgi:hypothetical protein